MVPVRLRFDVVARLPAFVYRLVGRYSVIGLDRLFHLPLYRLTGGRGVLGRSLGIDTILLTTRGRRSGEPRTVLLYGFPDAERWIVVASRGGTARLPAWYRNLVAEPRAQIQVRQRVLAVVASDADGAEYDRLWALADRSYPGYALYQERTPYRIPVVVLSPAAPG